MSLYKQFCIVRIEVGKNVYIATVLKKKKKETPPLPP